jgi:hypothetical protein
MGALPYIGFSRYKDKIFSKETKKYFYHMAKKTKKNPETIAVSIPKALQTKSEDAFIVREDGLLAVADGAGGVGIFAAEWAKYLLDSLPEMPFADADAFVLWTNSIWETFYQRIDNQEIAMEVKSKFMEEGSLATLVVLPQPLQRRGDTEARPQTSPKGKEIRSIRAFCYGDSAVMVYHPEKNTLRALPDTLATYTQHPYLINWKEEVHTAGILMRTFELSKQDKLLLCSDAIARL